MNNLGVALFAPLYGMPHETMTRMGHLKKAAENNPRADALLKQRVVSLASGIMKRAGLDRTKAGIHIEKIASTDVDSWTDHHLDVADTVSDVLCGVALEERSRGLHKKAFGFNDVTSGVRNIVEAGALVSAVLGAAAGATWFAADRYFGSDPVSIQKKEQELKHFKRVGENLQRKMESKYGYQPVESKRFYTPEEAKYV